MIDPLAARAWTFVAPRQRNRQAALRGDWPRPYRRLYWFEPAV